ncbi:DUF7504 family protein [Halorussus caseinilyticus]|uniref:Uncharacterized protein n=1 Tax=Halorussus caseinilyticus TaxID=3034025 RepID=A0ABD5WJQ3_9EURY|nr:hypothetical protein [Halorussus sp. DT72]
MSRSQSSPSNTLLEASTVPESATEEVFDALARPAETNLLVVSYRDTPDAWLRDWRGFGGDLPSEVGFVHVGNATRSGAVSGATRTTGGPSSSDDGPSVVKAVSDPTDLARVGVTASEYLETWEDNARQTVVYLDSLTALLESVAFDRAFEFFHVLAGRVESVDGRGYYLLDPTAHDHRSLSAVRELADAVVDLDATSEN